MFKQFTKVFILIPTLLMTGAFHSAYADWDLNYGGISASDLQDVVISLKSDPNHDPEAACLAVTFARSLSGNLNANITLFVTLDGVNLSSDTYISKKRLRKYKCTTPWGKISLKEHLATYIDSNDNKLVVCPICWKERYGEETLPDYGVLPGAGGTPGTAIGTMMFNADKILSF